MEKLGINSAWLITQVLNVILLLSIFAGPVLAVLALLFFWLLRGWNRPGAATSAPRETPLDTVKGRYARGEITREQFEQLRQDLER